MPSPEQLPTKDHQPIREGSDRHGGSPPAGDLLATPSSLTAIKSMRGSDDVGPAFTNSSDLLRSGNRELAMAGDGTGGKGDKNRSAEFKLLGDGTTPDGRRYLSFESPPALAVRDLRYFPDTNTFEMVPDKQLPARPADPTKPKKYTTENALPITKVAINPDSNEFVFQLANKGYITKSGLGKYLYFGQERSGALQMSGRVAVNDGKTFTVDKIDGLSGTALGLIEKPITSFKMEQVGANKPNEEPKYQVTPRTKDGPDKPEVARDVEDVKPEQFKDLADNWKLYTTTLGRLKNHIEDQNLIASAK